MTWHLTPLRSIEADMAGPLLQGMSWSVSALQSGERGAQTQEASSDGHKGLGEIPHVAHKPELCYAPATRTCWVLE